MVEISNRSHSWHSQTEATVLSSLQSDEYGLSHTEAKDRLARFGYNRLTPPPQRSVFMRFLSQFHSVLIYVLLIAAGVTLFLQHWVDSSVILGVVVINALIGFIQEGKAEKALDAIRKMLSHEALVTRDNKTRTVNAEELVAGDIVILQSGDKVPADIRLIKTKELRIDESILTGESSPVEKTITAVAQETVLADRKCMAYSGTLVTYGQARGVVVSTGDNTEIGHINALLHQLKPLATPLLEQMAAFGKWLTIAIGIIAAVTALFGTAMYDYSLQEMFLAAVGLAVAAIPEGLPAIMTITLAIGVQRMASRHAIIRRLPAVETLGAVSIICSDKTGTLTRNEMTVLNLITASGLFTVSGEGYDPHGSFSHNNNEIIPHDHPILYEVIQAATLCNDARVEEQQGQWLLHGDPTEGALITLGIKAGLDLDLQEKEWPRTDAIPFESQHRFMATLHHDHSGHGFIYIKGAPEVILSMCHHQRIHGEDHPLDLNYWHKQIENSAKQGYRLLAIAHKTATANQTHLSYHDIEASLTLLGIVGMIDPPRTEAIEAIRACKEASIKVKMITGDHASTAVAIGKQMGIGDGVTVLNGVELDNMNNEELVNAAERIDVFARTSPENKLRLVEALQGAGHVIGMTGDGVNDAPALKRANVGIAMGKKGTEVSKEAAEMVLADDNFASIVSAVEEGRTVYDNLKKAILFILPTNGGEAMILIAAILLGRALPITAAQILWINMITAVTLALALAFEPSERRVMQRPPRLANEPLLSPFLIWRIFLVASVILFGTFGLFVFYRESGASIEYARTVAVNTLVMFEIFYLFCSRFMVESVMNKKGLLGNSYALMAVGILLAIQLGFTYLSPFQTLFSTTSIQLSSWLLITAVATSVLVVVEIEKFVIRNFISDKVNNQ